MVERVVRDDEARSSNLRTPTNISPRASERMRRVPRGDDYRTPERVADPVGLLRIRALLFVTVCATFGVLLIILPWTPKWTDNPLLLSMPGLRPIVSNGFVRGLCSGLGLLDIWIGFSEAIHYHE